MFWYDRLIASRAARTSNVVPYDVIDRVLQVSDRLLTSRHTMTSYRDVIDRIVQVADRVVGSRHTVTSLTELPGVRPTFDITPYNDVIPWRHWPNCAGVRPIFWKRSIFWNHSKPTELHQWVTPLIWYCVNDGDWIVRAGIFPIDRI